MPGVGRFTSPDPIVPDYHQPQSINPYVYVRNNSINFTDPTGLWWCHTELSGLDCEDWVNEALRKLGEAGAVGARVRTFFHTRDVQLGGEGHYWHLSLCNEMRPGGLEIELGSIRNSLVEGSANSRYVALFLRHFPDVNIYDVARFGHELEHVRQSTASPGGPTVQREAMAYIVEHELRVGWGIEQSAYTAVVAGQRERSVLHGEEGPYELCSNDLQMMVDPYNLCHLAFYGYALHALAPNEYGWLQRVPDEGNIESGLPRGWLSQFGITWDLSQPRPTPTPRPVLPGEH